MLKVPANLTFFKEFNEFYRIVILCCSIEIYINYGSDLHMTVTMATILGHPARLDLITCLCC